MDFNKITIEEVGNCNHQWREVRVTGCIVPVDSCRPAKMEIDCINCINEKNGNCAGYEAYVFFKPEMSLSEKMKLINDVKKMYVHKEKSPYSAS